MDRIRSELQKSLDSLSPHTSDDQTSLFKRGEDAYDQKLLSTTISLLDDLTRLKKAGLVESLEKMSEDVILLLDEIESRGIWGQAPEEQELVMKMKQEIHNLRSPVRFTFDPIIMNGSKDDKGKSPNISIVEPPRIRRPLPGPSSKPPGLEDADAELALEEEINEVFFFHTLATAPEEIIPPGKSLRSAITRSEGRSLFDDTPPSSSSSSAEAKKNPSLQQKISEIVHKAFWDEALERLSDPSPPVQLARLRALYSDLHASLVDLIPINHPCMVTLSGPLSPTSSPLISAIRHLKEVAVELRRRCAPIRDAALDGLIQRLDEPGKTEERAKKYIDALRDVIDLAGVMQDDLAAVSLSGISDADLANEVTRVAKAREKRAISQLWGLDHVRECWDKWLREGNDLQAVAPSPSPSSPTSPPEIKWIRRLFQALGTDMPVSCQLPAGFKRRHSTADWAMAPGTSAEAAAKFSSNALPPVFFFWVAQLIHIQNVMQAVIAAAALRSLVPTPRIPSGSAGAEGNGESHGDGREPTFMERVWLLFKLELGKEEDTGTTKLINFADEVVREWKRLHPYKPAMEDTSSDTSFSPSPPSSSSSKSPTRSDEDRLRAAVDRILRPTDPVFILLKRRLIDGIVSTLSTASSMSHPSPSSPIPDVMQTGLYRNKSGRSQLSPFPRTAESLLNASMSSGEHAAHAQVDGLVVKGFDDPVLRKVVVDLVWEVGNAVEWVRDLWKDTLEGIR